MQELSSEKFKAVVELAELQKQIAVMRAELADWQSAKEQFLIDREAEVKTIVDNALSASRGAIEESEENLTAIASLLTVVNDCVEDVQSMKQNLADAKVEFETSVNKTIIAVKEKQDALEQQTREIKQRRAKVKDDEQAIEVARAEIARDRILLKDRLKMLSDEMKRVKSKQI